MPVQARANAKSWTVPAGSKELRLDAFARRCLPYLSRRALEQAIADRLFTINGKVANKGSRLRAGDALGFTGPDEWLVARPQPAGDLVVPIVYEDASLLAVNKPAGMPTHGFSGRDEATIANFLITIRPELHDVGKSRWEPGLVHRLDRDTSGLLLIAKTQAGFDALRQQFHRREITKKYLALVHGDTQAIGSVSYPLVHDSRDRRRMRPLVDSVARSKERKSWRAVTRFRKLTARRGVSLLEVEMQTGVTHQIRAHLAAIGHPIIADALYGNPDAPTFGLRRHFLHAWSLAFRHPDGGVRMVLKAELTGELRKMLDELQIKV